MKKLPHAEELFHCSEYMKTRHCIVSPTLLPTQMQVQMQNAQSKTEKRFPLKIPPIFHHTYPQRVQYKTISELLILEAFLYKHH